MKKLLTGILFFVACIVSATERPEVLLMMSSHANKAKSALISDLADGKDFTLTHYSAKGKSDEQVAADWQKADLVLLDGINPALSGYMFGKYQGIIASQTDLRIVSLGDIDNAGMNKGLDPQVSQTIAAYYQNAGRKNYRNMLNYIEAEVLALKQVSVEAPVSVPAVGLYHREFVTQLTDQESTFYNWLDPENSPVIAIAMHRSVVDYEQTHIVDELISGLEVKGAKAFGFFYEGNDEDLTYPELLMDEQQSRVDLMINYRSLHYAEKRRKEFEQIGVPVIHALNYSEGDEQAFMDDHTGISPSLTPFFLVMPEDTGSMDPVIIAATEEGKKVAMTPQINALVERAFNHAKLRRMRNQDKKIATFIWNYPPGEKNIGAAFLDVPSSIEQIALAMQQNGYAVDVKDDQWLIDSAGKLLRPYYRNENSEQLIELGLADYLPMTTYLDWFNGLPAFVSEPIVERWGLPEDNFMVTEHQGQKAFIIPRMDLGNMIVLPQGARSNDAKEATSLYHDTKTPINHSYLAIYLYARETFGADAFIHLGTHGSQEWLTGKERGLSVFDAPNLSVGNIPVFYPYIIDNVGEAMQAKRRGRATMISHLTPGFAKAGLYTDVAKLNELIGNYLMLEQGQTKSNTADEIVRMANALNILTDLEMTVQQMQSSLDDNISKIQDHLNSLAQQSQPLGVHTFGLLPKEQHLVSTMLQMLGEGFVSEANAYEQQMGMQLPAEQQTDERDVVQLEALPGFQLLQAHINGQPLSGLSESLQSHLVTAKTYWDNFQNIAEISALMAALEGHYIEISTGGDPIRNPQAAPTGRNLVGFNPAKVPSKEAYDAGVKLMDQTIADYVAKHGKYPDKLAFSLWSLETMRHQGAMEAQILHAMGLKPKWDRRGNVVGTEVIPYSELGRPRIDVAITATGLYRDAFPNVMLWMAKAIDQVAKMKEENNFLYKNALNIKASLLEQGQSEEDADYLSSIRIFSNETGNYGTGLAASSLASDTWESDAKLADLYLRRMGFAFGKDESRWSENVSETGLYSQVLSGTDGVIFSRSTNLYALLTNDDPFQYFGGIGLAVRHLDGATPEMYVSNLRKKDQIKAQTMKDFLNQEMRSRYFHPRWIQAMQESGYAGATAILDRMNNMWGWEVMTPEAVRDDHWQEFFEVYVDDKYQMDMREFFEKANPEALAQMLERMLEAVRKDYWQADAQTLKKMIETYIELANQHDVVTGNQAFTEYVKQQSSGFGLMPLQPGQSATAAQPSPSKVTGQQLKQVEQAANESDTDYTVLWGLLGIFMIGVFSTLVDLRQRPRLA